MFSFEQKKIARNTKKQVSKAHTQGKKKSKETVPVGAQTLDFKLNIINTFKKIKKG